MPVPTVSPTHPDAEGHLNDLASEIGHSWFRMICDLVLREGVSAIEPSTSEVLTALYMERASYIGGIAAIPVAGPPPAPTSANNLEQLSGFSNFKAIGPSLALDLQKRVTLIFGTNGSGKSSLCEALKVLAATQTPLRPLQNLRAATPGNPSFNFKFARDMAPQNWTSASGYGIMRDTVKYFDTGIALGNIKDAIAPGRVIHLAPFRLHIFDSVKKLVSDFREALQTKQRENSDGLNRVWLGLKPSFERFTGTPLAMMTTPAEDTIDAAILIGESPEDPTILGTKLAAIAELEKASSEDGLKILRAERGELDAFLDSLDMLLDSTSKLWELSCVAKTQSLGEKQVAQEALASALIPQGTTLDKLLALLHPASSVCTLDDADGKNCPLCQQELHAPQIELFKRYHTLLNGELEKEISALKEDIKSAKAAAAIAKGVDPESWKNFSTISADIIAAANVQAEIIGNYCATDVIPNAEARTAFDALKTFRTEWGLLLDGKASAIASATSGRAALLEELKTARAEAAPLEYAHCVAQNLNSLKELKEHLVQAQFWNTKVPTFTPLLGKITNKAKTAHEELVVRDFQDILNAEYKALAEKDMAAFGVTLARRGVDAAVTVQPQVGGKDIEVVLSEGEQRLHALALFFAEFSSSPQTVFVFDDPISSFDFNYITNYCNRLRDVIQAHPSKQIVVLTHNWEFFIQLQQTLNKARLDSHLSIQVLENCCSVADYSEKIGDLKLDIQAVLGVAAEPSKAQKEAIAGKMRRLIEAVTNTHVFNGQRHQFKEKSLVISAFETFTKVVALLPAEAATLKDLYAKLSVTEHDDPRNAYVNTDKAMFQTRYDSILSIEAAVISRK